MWDLQKKPIKKRKFDFQLFSGDSNANIFTAPSPLEVIATLPFLLYAKRTFFQSDQTSFVEANKANKQS